MLERYEIENIEQLRAVADLLRLRIIDMLQKQPMTVTQLGEMMGEAPAKMHYHVRELEKAGLLKLVETREKGGILEKYYQPIARELSVDRALLSAPSDEVTKERGTSMVDLRIQRLAKLLVHYSLDLRKGDRLAIQTQPLGAPLVLELVREALRAGAHPEYFITLPGAMEITFQEASDEQLRYIPVAQRSIVEEYEAAIAIVAAENTKAMSGINPERMAVKQQALSDLSVTQLRRTNPDDPHAPGSLRWNGVLLPTNASAQDAEMSLADFENFVYRAYFLDEEDPVANWQALSKQQERMVQWLKGKRTVRLLGQDTDLTFSIEGRAFINDDAHYNMPGGEFFTGPVEHTANGFIRYSFPATFQGRSVEDVRLRFENGVVVKASAAQGQEFLDKMLSLDEGARRLGEFAFGNNKNVDRCIKHTLFDEKMGGTVHLALGASIPQTGGVNYSALHWDMVCDLRAGSEVLVDGELFAKDGQFVI